jgi:hypothetical protein
LVAGPKGCASPSDVENGKCVKSNPEELVKAFRRVAKKLGCDKSEQRFQEVLFAISARTSA